MKKITLLCIALCIFGFGFSQTFTDSSGPYDLQNGNGTTDATCATADELTIPLTVSGIGVLGTTNLLESISIEITHTWADDINLSLQSPDGSVTVLLIENKGGQADGFSVVLDDSAPSGLPDLGGDGPAVSGTYMPDNPLSGFDGIDADGNWNLIICDDAGGDIGSLDSWSLIFSPVPTCTAAVVDNSTVVPDCGSSQFSVDVVVSDAGDAGTVIDDGTNTFPVVAGTVTVGPYAVGTTVTLNVVHVDNACDYSLGNFEYNACPPSNDTCATAEVVTFGAPGVCGPEVTGNNAGATDSGEAAPSCGDYAGGDLWYSVTLPSGITSFDFSLNTSAFSTTKTALYDTTAACGSLVEVLCQNSYAGNTYTFSGLTGGSEYLLRLYDWGNNDFGDVTFCVALPPACTAAVVDSSTVVPDCGSSQFSVDVVVSDAGDAGTVIDDGTNTFPVVAGTVTVGPYTTGSIVTLNVVHVDNACDFSLGDFEYDSCPTTVMCGTPVNETYCYPDNDTTVFTYTSDDGSALQVTFNAGQVEDSWDELIVLDSDGTTELYNGYGAAGDVSGLSFTSTGDTISVRVQSDGSGNCQDDGYTSLDYDVICLACIPGAATASLTDDCGAYTFTLDVDVTTLGDITHVNDGTTSHPVVAGVNTLPVTYNYGDSITLTAEHSDSDCDFEIGTYASACPPPTPTNDLLANAIAINCGDDVMGTTLGATQDEATAPGVATVEDDTSADNDSPWVWYLYTGSGVSEEITLSTCGVANTDFDTELFVYTGTSGSLNLIDDGYDECGGSAENYAAETTFTSDGTTTYYIAVGGYDSGDVGNFQLSVNCVTLTTEEFSINDQLFTYYPNPVDNTLSIKGQKNISNVSVYNMLGQEVIKTAPNTVEGNVDMSALQSGAYFVKVTIGETTETIRIIKN